jgi:N-acetylneuraminic acid mutarotase
MASAYFLKVSSETIIFLSIKLTHPSVYDKKNRGIPRIRRSNILRILPPRLIYLLDNTFGVNKMKMKRSSSLIVTLLFVLVQCGSGQSSEDKINLEDLRKSPHGKIVWTATADLPLPFSPSNVCALNGKLYLMGGRQNAIQKDVNFTLEYDPQMDQWTKKTDLPFKSHLHTIVPLGGKIYLFSSDMQNNLVYDPHADSWEPIASNTDKRIPGPCVAYRGKIYVMGGIHNIIFDLSDRIDVYDPETNSWSQNKPMQNVRLGLCAVVDDKILVIGGWQPVAGQKRVQTARTVQVYDPVSEKWENKSDLPFGLVGTAVSLGSKVYVMGCSTGEIPGQTKDLTTVLMYDISNDIWQTTTPLPRLAVGAGFTVLNESIYLIGGCAGQQHGWSDYASTFRGDIVE